MGLSLWTKRGRADDLRSQTAPKHAAAGRVWARQSSRSPAGRSLRRLDGNTLGDMAAETRSSVLRAAGTIREWATLALSLASLAVAATALYVAWNFNERNAAVDVFFSATQACQTYRSEVMRLSDRGLSVRSV